MKTWYYKQGAHAGKARHFMRNIKVSIYTYSPKDNPYNIMTGGQGKRLKADWHNGFVQGRKESISERASNE